MYGTMPLGAFQSASFAITVRSEVNKAFDERLYFTGFALATARARLRRQVGSKLQCRFPVSTECEFVGPSCPRRIPKLQIEHSWNPVQRLSIVHPAGVRSSRRGGAFGVRHFGS